MANSHELLLKGGIQKLVRTIEDNPKLRSMESVSDADKSNYKQGRRNMTKHVLTESQKRSVALMSNFIIR
jgi:hypothetical protein